jgi:HSP20 family protein
VLDHAGFGTPLDREKPVLTVRGENAVGRCEGRTDPAKADGARPAPAVEFRRGGVTMLTRWDPFVDFARLSKDLFAFEPPLAKENGAPRFTPAVDVFEEQDALVLAAELPGLKAADVKVDVEKNVLTLSGERKLEKEEAKKGYHRLERSYGAFSRSFVLPDSVDGEKIEAALADGILTIRVPKRPQSQPRKIEVKSH